MSKRRRSGFQSPLAPASFLCPARSARGQVSIASIAPRARLLSLSGAAATLCASGERRALPPSLAAAHARRRIRDRVRAHASSFSLRPGGTRAPPPRIRTAAMRARDVWARRLPRREKGIPLPCPFLSGRPRPVCSAGPRPAFARPAARESAKEKQKRERKTTAGSSARAPPRRRGKGDAPPGGRPRRGPSQESRRKPDDFYRQPLRGLMLHKSECTFLSAICAHGGVACAQPFM